MRLHKVILALIAPLTIQAATTMLTATWIFPALWVTFVFALFVGYLLLIQETGEKHALLIALAYFPAMSVALLYLTLDINGTITGNWL